MEECCSHRLAIETLRGVQCLECREMLDNWDEYESINEMFYSPWYYFGAKKPVLKRVNSEINVILSSHNVKDIIIDLKSEDGFVLEQNEKYRKYKLLENVFIKTNRRWLHVYVDF